jgi:predicted transglutaminase-like cysteine proteinase
MWAQLIPEAYDVEGRPTSAVSRKQRHLFEPNFPVGRYMSQPLRRQYTSIRDVQRFLRGCKYISDRKQFGRDDFWQLPERFEETRKGDCDDFSMWTWRQLVGMGHQARYVVGRAGKYGGGHAWITFKRDGNWFLLEPLEASQPRLARLSTLRYEPEGSIEWRNGKPQYFVHETPKTWVALWRLPILAAGWVINQLVSFLYDSLVLVSWPFRMIARVVSWIRRRRVRRFG